METREIILKDSTLMKLDPNNIPTITLRYSVSGNSSATLSKFKN